MSLTPCDLSSPPLAPTHSHPRTPSPPPSHPALRLTLPTPPSFAMHRAQSYSSDTKVSDEHNTEGLDHPGPTPNHRKRFSASAITSLSSLSKDPAQDGSTVTTKKDRRVSFPQELIGKISPPILDGDEHNHHGHESIEQLLSPKSPVYKIPQRQSFSLDNDDDHPLTSKASASLADPPRAALSRRPLSYQGPLPSPSSPSRFASTAAARGLSIAPSLAKGGAFGSKSIWSAGVGTSLGSGWISPDLASARSARSTGSAAPSSANPTTAVAKQRGLSIAVLKQGGEVVPVSPGLASPGAGLKGTQVKALGSAKALAMPDSAKTDVNKGREIILCKFYHTPGLTCTSRPCRFVHSLDTVLLQPQTAKSGVPLLSPTRQDPTRGTFAQAQSTTPELSKPLRLRDGVDLTSLGMGDKVVVEDEDGHEVVGHVFLMSGGGNGPGGKSRDKYKTVPCKDYAEGHCPYGDYCSFVHEDKCSKVEDEPKPAAKPNGANDSEAPTKRIIHRKSSSLGSSLNAWVKAIPKAILVPAVKLDSTVLDRSRAGLSAFALPFTKTQVEVDKTGEIVSADESPLRSPVQLTGQIDSSRLTEPSTESIPAKVATNAWAKGPPASLRKVASIKEGLLSATQSADHAQPDENLRPPSFDSEVGLKTPTSATHLVPPPSATSIFGTESDPATPFDPVTHRRKVQQLEEEARARAAAANPSRQLPRSNLANIAFDAHAPSQRQSFGQNHSRPQSPLASPDISLSFSYDQVFTPTSVHLPFNAPSYPWGMPMSPITPEGQQKSLPRIQGGLGVMWTPAGWAVQDAAMKSALRGAEIRTKHQDVKLRKPRIYFRTRPCKFFAEGFCPHGDECTYLHIAPVASPDSTSGSSSDNESPFATSSPPARWISPTKIRTIPCKFFNSAAGCTNGDSCTFLHTKVVPDSVPLVDRPRPWRTKPCRHFQLGRCTLGDACHFAHVPDPAWIASGNSNPIYLGVLLTAPNRSRSQSQPRMRGQICEAWSKTGRCADDEACIFKHVGEGGEGNMERLTEEGLERALEEMRLEHRRGLRIDEHDQDDEDDVEIITGVPTTPSSLAASVRA